jgi:hypothetical protein
MRKISAIARLTLRVLFRSGGGGALLLLTAVLMCFIYFVSSADGALQNELALRTRYALYFGNTVFSLALLWLACVSMRGDIDSKRMHLLTSYPLERVRIYVGKWLGLAVYGMIGVAVMLGTVNRLNWWTIWRWQDADEKAQVQADRGRVEREVHADAPDVSAQVAAAFQKMVDDGVDLGTPGEQEDLRQTLMHEARMRQQLIPSNGGRRWSFNMGTVPLRRETIRMQFRFYAQQDDQKMQGTFRFSSLSDPDRYETRVTFYPRHMQSIDVPISVVPDDGPLTVEFIGDGTPSLMAYQDTGVRLYYEDRGYASNMANYAGIMMAHYAALVAVGLTISTLFTLSIATFVSTVLYLLAVTGDFFQRFLNEELGLGEPGPFEEVIRRFIQFGLFFTTGLEQPDVIENLSGSVAIGLDNVGMEITAGVGAVLLTPIQWVSA